MTDEAAPPRELFMARLAIGLLQGLALFFLYRASQSHAWPATDPYAIAPLLLIALYVPLLVTQAAGSMRLPTLIGWAIVATLFCAVGPYHSTEPSALAAAMRASMPPAWSRLVASAMDVAPDDDAAEPDGELQAASVRLSVNSVAVVRMMRG